MTRVACAERIRDTRCVAARRAAGWGRARGRFSTAAAFLPTSRSKTNSSAANCLFFSGAAAPGERFRWGNAFFKRAPAHRGVHQLASSSSSSFFLTPVNDEYRQTGLVIEPLGSASSGGEPPFNGTMDFTYQTGGSPRRKMTETDARRSASVRTCRARREK